MNDESTKLYQLSSSSYIWSGHSRNILDFSYQHELKYLRLLHLLPRWSQVSLTHLDQHEVPIIPDLTIFSKSQSRRASNVLLITSELQCAGSELGVLHDKSDIQVFHEIWLINMNTCAIIIWSSKSFASSWSLSLISPSRKKSEIDVSCRWSALAPIHRFVITLH